MYSPLCAYIYREIERRLNCHGQVMVTNKCKTCLKYWYTLMYLYLFTLEYVEQSDSL